MKRLLFIVAVVFFAFAGGYVLGKTHRVEIYLEPDAVDLLLDEQDSAQLGSQPVVLQADYKPTPAECKKTPNWCAIQDEYTALRPTNVLEVTTMQGKQWTACGDSKVSVTYKFYTDPEEDQIRIDQVKKK